MADLQKTVEIVFGGRNELSKIVGDVERSLDSLNTASQPFADMADNVLRAELAVLALGAAFAGLSINQAGNFGDQFAEITTLIDVNVSDLDGYRQSIIEYANDSTQSLDSINGAVYSAISAGVDYSEALGVMSDAEKLAVAGKADLQSTLVALASVMNAYGASTEEASDYSDIFFTTVKQGQTTIPELAASLSQVTSIANSAGVPFDDLSAAIAALTASGMPTTQAITSIKAALSNIIKPSKDAQEVAAELGIEFNSTALKTQGLDGFLQSLQKATGGNIDVMSRLFGSVEGLNGVMTLASDSSGIFADSLAAMESRSGATAAAFEKMVDNFGLSNQKLVNNIQTVLIGVGSKLLDDYGDVVNSLIANLQGIGSAVDAGDLDGLIGIFESAIGDINKILSSLSDSLPEALAGIDWSNLASSFENLKDSVGDGLGDIFGDVDLSTVEGVQAAIQTLVDLLTGLTNTSAGVIDGMKPLFVGLGVLAQNFADADASGQEFAGKILGIGKSVNEITGFLSGATDAVAGLTNGLLLLGGGSMLSGISKLVTSLGGAGGLTSALAAVAKAAGPAAAVGVSGAGGWWLGSQINDGIDSIVEKFSDEESLGGLIYEWIHGGDENIDVEVAKVVHSVNTIPEAAKEASYEFEAIEWNLDPDGNLLGTVTATREALDELARNTKAFDEIKAQYIALGTSPEIAAAMANIEVETKRIPKAVKDAKTDVKKESEELIIELAKIAADERINMLEIGVDFKIEQLRADADVAKEIISTLGTAIESTGNLLGDLAGTLNDYTGSDRRRIEDLLESEEKRRQEAFEQNKKLTQAEIDLLNERVKAMQSGDPLIQIDGAGLEPEIEAFMFKILQNLQVRMSEEYQSLLLGIN